MLFELVVVLKISKTLLKRESEETAHPSLINHFYWMDHSECRLGKKKTEAAVTACNHNFYA